MRVRTSAAPKVSQKPAERRALPVQASSQQVQPALRTLTAQPAPAGARSQSPAPRTPAQACQTQAALPLPASFECDALTFSVEVVGPRL